MVICSIFHTGSPLVYLQGSLPLCLARLTRVLLLSSLAVQIARALTLLILLLVSVNVLGRAAEHDRLPHVGVVVDLPALVVAGGTHATRE